MSRPSLPNIAAIDLNLLVALEALLKEKNVTRAGKRVGLTQSAMSHALKRLRELVGDPLLVKSGHSLRLTTFAEELEPKIARLMLEIRETLLAGAHFDPATDRRQFTIAADDYCGLVLLSPLIARLRRLAPGIELRIRPLAPLGPWDALASGELDLAIGTYLRPPRLIHTARLFEEHFVCVVAKKRKALSLEEFAAHDHVLITAPGEGPGVVDEALAKLGLSRRVAVRVPFFLVAPAIIAETDCVLTVAARIAKQFEQSYALRLFPPPLALPPFTVSMCWHSRTDRDPARSWLREQVQALGDPQ